VEEGKGEEFSKNLPSLGNVNPQKRDKNEA
jgi:hypothetical protein